MLFIGIIGGAAQYLLAEALREAVGELDAEVEAFLRRGFQSVEITFDEEAGYREYTGAGTDFMEVEHILRDLEGFRAMVEHYEPGTLLHTIHARRPAQLLGALVCLDARRRHACLI